MKRADLEKRAQRDKFGSGKHGFQGGNPATGQLPTIPGAEWFDHVQEEICRVIESAGITINPQEHGQLLQALRKLYPAASAQQAGVAKLIDNLTAGGTDAALTAEQGKALKQLIDGISGDAVIYKAATKLDTALGLNRVVGVHDNGGGIPAGAYPYGVAVSLAGGAGRGQIYIAHTGGIWARGSYQGNTTHNWYRVDGADWADVRGKPTNLAGYGITDAASRTDVTQAAPPGTVMYFAGRNPPAGWLKANGAAVSRTTYAPLFAAIGTTYGSGDGRTTFNLPDLRGEFVRGWDDGRGVDNGRGFSTRQADQVTEHYHGVGWGDSGNDGYFHKNTWQREGHEHYYAVAGEGSFIVHDTTRQPAHNNHEFATSGVNGQTGETRPRNVALLACIKI